MGIYSSGKAYGIKIAYNYREIDYNLECDTYERKYDSVMTDEQKREAFEYYQKLENNKQAKLYLYTEVFTTYNPKDKGASLMWYPIGLTDFLREFSV